LRVRTGGVANPRPPALGIARPQGTQEVADLPSGMAVRARSPDFPAPHRKGGKEIPRARAAILNLLPFAQARPPGQRGGPAVQGLEVSLLLQTQAPTARGRLQVAVDNLRQLLRKQRGGARQEIPPAMRLESQLSQNPWDRRRAHAQNFPPSSDPPGHVTPAGVRKAPTLLLLNRLAGDGDARGPRQRGNKPGGDPPGASPAGPLGALSERLRPPPLAGRAQTRQSAGAPAAPNSVRGPLDLQSPDWPSSPAPLGEGSRAAPSGAGACPRAVARPMPVVRQRLTESHRGGRAYSPHSAQRCREYTAKELTRHGTRL